MKYYFFILISLSIFVGCKVQQKNNLNKESAVLVKPKQKEVKAVIASINAKYMLEDSSNVKVFMVVDISNTNADTDFKKLNEIFRIQWSIQPEYGIKEKLKSGRIEFSEEYFIKKDNFYYLSFNIPKPKDIAAGILFIEFIDIALATKYTNDMPIDFMGKRVDSRFNVFESANSNFPNFTTFITAGKPFVIKALKTTEEKIYLKKYKNKSLAALSPMSSTKRDVSEEFEAQEVIEIKLSEPIILDSLGLYVLTQKPDFHNDGFGFLVVNDRYPKLTFAEQIKEPLIYMSTPEEITQITTTENAKDAIDLYLLSMSKGNQTLSKQVMKAYFKRVEDANKLFSSYKDGWKTDKGMVYVIMGPPSRVQRNRQREVWLYAQSQNSSEIIFTFYRKANSFTDQNFELVRYPEYSSFWYPYVEAWRTGNVAE
jgi:GWxTD domain-containing protein